LFEASTQSAEKSAETSVRIDNIWRNVLKNTYTEVCRTLLQKDRILFSFNMIVKLEIYAKNIVEEEYVYLIYGNTQP